MNEADICLGCFRSLDNIMEWRSVTDQRRREIVVLAEGRKAEYKLNYEAFLDSVVPGDK